MYLGKLSQGITSKEISQQHSSRAVQKVQKNEREKERTHAVQQKRDESRIL